MTDYPKNKSETYNVSGGIDVKSSKYVTEANEVLELVNLNFQTVGAFTKRPGTTLYLGATVSGRVGGVYEFEKLSGASYIVAGANTNFYNVTNSWSSVRSGLLNNGIMAFETFVDRLFVANGQDFFKFDGSNTSNYSLPQGQSTSAFGVTGIYNASAGLSGVYIASYGYLNDRGYYGPGSAGITVSLNGISYNALLYYGMTFPTGYGISALVFYRSAAGQVNQYGTTQTTITTGSTFVDYSALSARPMPEYLWFTAAPQFMEIYNNQLFLGGISSAPSTLYWSDIGEPEGIDPTFNTEVRTNDGDVLRGIKSYGNDLIVAKQKSFHRLNGDNPENFILQQISDQYGCLSHRTMVTYNNILLFLDEKGIIKYNGANIEILSNRVEDYFLRMNKAAAVNNALAVHFKKYNEIWFHIPIDGATLNNFTVVYDYLADAFTTYQGFNASSLSEAKGAVAEKTLLYGGYSGALAYFSDSVKSDLGQGITCYFQTRFTSLMGQSTEQQFRRFFLNVDPVLGVTQTIGVDFRVNYGSSVISSRTMYQSPFQSRIDFGIPAKTLSASVSHYSATLSFKCFGWTIESRFQRPV